MTSFYVSETQSTQVFETIREKTDVEKIHGVYAHDTAPYIQFEFESAKDCIQVKKAVELENVPTYLAIA